MQSLLFRSVVSLDSPELFPHLYVKVLKLFSCLLFNLSFLQDELLKVLKLAINPSYLLFEQTFIESLLRLCLHIVHEA